MVVELRDVVEVGVVYLNGCLSGQDVCGKVADDSIWSGRYIYVSRYTAVRKVKHRSKN
jgi:hypothetical protein